MSDQLQQKLTCPYTSCPGEFGGDCHCRTPASQNSNNDLLNALEVVDSYCCYIFQNSESFLDRFFGSQNVMELVDVYFAPSELKVYYVLHCGQHVTTSIPLTDYLSWLQGDTTPQPSKEAP